MRNTDIRMLKLLMQYKFMIYNINEITNEFLKYMNYLNTKEVGDVRT